MQKPQVGGSGQVCLEPSEQWRGLGGDGRLLGCRFCSATAELGFTPNEIESLEFWADK